MGTVRYRDRSLRRNDVRAHVVLVDFFYNSIGEYRAAFVPTSIAARVVVCQVTVATACHLVPVTIAKGVVHVRRARKDPRFRRVRRVLTLRGLLVEGGPYRPGYEECVPTVVKHRWIKNEDRRYGVYGVAVLGTVVDVPAHVLAMRHVVSSFDVVVFVNVGRRKVRAICAGLALPVSVRLRIGNTVLPIGFTIAQRFHVFSSHCFLADCQRSIFPKDSQYRAVFVSFYIVLPMEDGVIVSCASEDSWPLNWEERVLPWERVDVWSADVSF